MSLVPSSQYQTRGGYVPNYSSRTSEMDKVMCLSRQKLRLESARGEPDLRKLLAHVCTVEHVQEWLLANPPSCKAPPPPPQDFELNDQEGEVSSSLHEEESERSIHNRTTGDHRRTVTAVREVDPDDERDSSDDEEFGNGPDTSDDTVLDLFACEPQFCHLEYSPAVTVCRDFAFDGEKDAETWTGMSKLLLVRECKELAKVICK